MSIVYVVQNQKRREGDKFVPKFNLEPAREFGTVNFLLGPTANPFEPEEIVRDLHFALKDFSKEDFLLLVGNPVLIGLATAVAADYTGGAVNFLQWSGTKKRYIPVKVGAVFPGVEDDNDTN